MAKPSAWFRSTVSRPSIRGKRRDFELGILHDHAMIEIRNDLIAQERGQDEWAQRISVALGHAIA
jgi:predicted N-formylglutamate amidohydrolase